MDSPATPKTVLVVDDDQDIALVMEDFLKEAGYQVDVAYDGMDALSKIQAHNYDAVVCDMVMPRMTGDMLYHEVEKASPCMNRRFLFVTGMAQVNDCQRFFEQTGSRTVEKPFHVDEVLQIVAEIIAENQE